MNNQHIIELLDSAALHTLSAEQAEVMRTHAASCENCRRAYDAAHLAAFAVRERAGVAIEPSPFFQTRVMAAWRAQQERDSVPAIVRLWKSAGALVFSMALATVALAALSFAVPAGSAGTGQETASLSSYSAEGVLIDQNSGDDQLTYGQVLNTIYAGEDEAK